MRLLKHGQKGRQDGTCCKHANTTFGSTRKSGLRPALLLNPPHAYQLGEYLYSLLAYNGLPKLSHFFSPLGLLINSRCLCHCAFHFFSKEVFSAPLRAHAFLLSANGTTDSRRITHSLKIHTRHLKTATCMRTHTHTLTHMNAYGMYTESILQQQHR